MEHATVSPTIMTRIVGLIEEIVNTRDRGMLADLRHGLNPATEYRAWPHLVRAGCLIANEKILAIWKTVAGGAAILKANSDDKYRNLGDVLRDIDAVQAGKETEGRDGRFCRLLACESTLEICEHIAGVFTLAERSGTRINFTKLFFDLYDWDDDQKRDNIKRRWAQSYWGTRSKGDQENKPSVRMEAKQ